MQPHSSTDWFVSALVGNINRFCILITYVTVEVLTEKKSVIPQKRLAYYMLFVSVPVQPVRAESGSATRILSWVQLKRYKTKVKDSVQPTRRTTL